MDSTPLQLARRISDLFADLPEVAAVALGGSRGSAADSTDAASDIDIYVYTRGNILLKARRSIVKKVGGATKASLDLNYWGPGDEWFHAPTGLEIDIVYFEAAWMEEQLARVLEKHQASLGYTTCFWFTLRNSIILFEREGWLSKLQERYQAEYPEELRQNIVNLNQPVLREIIPSYSFQLKKAAKRRDLVSVNHRLAALLASYFDILFAVNCLPHPGEKRLVEFALRNCAKLPADMEADLTALLQCAGADLSALPAHLDHLLDQLDQLLKDEGLLPQSSS